MRTKAPKNIVQKSRISASAFQRGMAAGLRLAGRRMGQDCSRNCGPVERGNTTECTLCFYKDLFDDLAKTRADDAETLSVAERLHLAISVLTDQHATLMKGTCEGGCPDEHAIAGLEGLLVTGRLF